MEVSRGERLDLSIALTLELSHLIAKPLMRAHFVSSIGEAEGILRESKMTLTKLP